MRRKEHLESLSTKKFQRTTFLRWRFYVRRKQKQKTDWQIQYGLQMENEVFNLRLLQTKDQERIKHLEGQLAEFLDTHAKDVHGSRILWKRGGEGAKELNKDALMIHRKWVKSFARHCRNGLESRLSEIKHVISFDDGIFQFIDPLLLAKYMPDDFGRIRYEIILNLTKLNLEEFVLAWFNCVYDNTDKSLEKKITITAGKTLSASVVTKNYIGTLPFSQAVKIAHSNRRIKNFSEDLNEEILLNFIERLFPDIKEDDPHLIMTDKDKRIKLMHYLKNIFHDQKNIVFDNSMIDRVNAYTSGFNFVIVVRLLIESLKRRLPGHPYPEETLPEILKITRLIQRTTLLERSRKYRDLNRIEEFYNECLDCHRDAEKLIKDLTNGHQIFVSKCIELTDTVREIDEKIKQGAFIFVNDPLEIEKNLRFVAALDYEAVEDLLNPLDKRSDFDATRELLSKYATEIRQIFHYYAACNIEDREEHGSIADETMSFFEFLRFVSHIRLNDKNPKLSPKFNDKMNTRKAKDFKATKFAKKLFVQSDSKFSKEVDPNAPKHQALEKIQIFGDGLIELPEFIDLILRLAKWKASKQWPELANLSEKMERMLKVHVFPFGGKMNTDFELLINKQEVRDLLTRHNAIVREVYNIYAMKFDAPLNSKGPESMNKTEFFSFLRMLRTTTEIGKESTVIREEEFNYIYDTYVSTDGDEEMCYEEFVQVICFLCMFCFPNPYTSYVVKLERFICGDIQNVLSKEKKLTVAKVSKRLERR